MANKKDKTSKQKRTQAIQLDKLLGLEFKTRLVLGECSMDIGDIISLGHGAVLELDTHISAPLQIWVNDKLIAKAETVVVNERFGAKIVEISATEERLKGIADVE